MTHEERLALAIEFNKIMAATKKAGQIATRDMILEDSLSIEEINTLVEIYPKWEPGQVLSSGDLVAYNNILYKVIQAHMTQADWTPDITPAMFTGFAPIGVIPEWIQPSGSHDAYNIGDKVIFNNKVYESIINGNTWSPTDYPAGWKLI